MLTDEGLLFGASKVDVLQMEEPLDGRLVPEVVKGWPEALVLWAQEHMLTSAGQCSICTAVGHEGREHLLAMERLQKEGILKELKEVLAYKKVKMKPKYVEMKSKALRRDIF